MSWFVCYRIQIFQEKTKVLIEEYKKTNKHKKIDSRKSKEQVFDQLCDIIEPYHQWYVLKSIMPQNIGLIMMQPKVLSFGVYLISWTNYLIPLSNNRCHKVFPSSN